MNTIASIRRDCSVKGWDGYSADPISEQVLENAEKIQDALPSGFELFATGLNSVQFEQEKTISSAFTNVMTEKYIEIEVFSDKVVAFHSEKSDTPNGLYVRRETSESITFNDLDKCIKYLPILLKCKTKGNGDGVEIQ